MWLMRCQALEIDADMKKPTAEELARQLSWVLRSRVKISDLICLLSVVAQVNCPLQYCRFSLFIMGRLNKALSKKMGAKKAPVAGGLSGSAAKALLDLKASLKMPVEGKESAPAPNEDIVTFSKSPVKVDKVGTAGNGLKKNFKTVEKAGKVTKVGKKERMKARTGFLMKKLSAEEAEKKAVKAKKIREKVVIVKDIKPMLDDLEDIEQEMKEKEAQDKILKLQKPKKSKSTQKKGKAKKQFLADLEFLKAASCDPQYVKNPLETVSLHLKNTFGVQ